MALAADAEPGSGAAGLFAADEEVGRDLAAVDWAATPLGPPGSWPQSLQTAVGHPAVVALLDVDGLGAAS